MNKRAISPRFPYIGIRIRFSDFPLEFESEAFIDTGFDGELILPLSLLGDLPSTSRRTSWRMADGSSLSTPSYPVLVQIGELANAFEANESLLGDQLMIGRMVTNRFKVTLDHGSEVMVEP